jgi:hypothetical protein
VDLYSIMPVSDRAKSLEWFSVFFGRSADDDILARLAAHGIEPEQVDTYGNGVRHAVVLDPDRNSLSLAQVPAQ